MHNSKNKPKILTNPDFLTQASNQKFTLQNVTSQIGGIIDFAKKQLVTDKIRESQAMSKKIIQSEVGHIQSQYSSNDNTIEDISTQLKEYEQYIQNIPKFLTAKLQELTERRAPEEALKEEDQNSEEEEEDDDGRKKKKSTAKGKKAAGGKKGGKEENKAVGKEGDEDEELAIGLQKMSMDKDLYENSEEEEKEWFKEDFGRGPEAQKGKKNAAKGQEKPKTRAAAAPRGRGRGKTSAAKDSEDVSFSESEEILFDKSDKKKGRKRNEPFKGNDDDDEFDVEEEANPKLKKTKMVTSQKTTGKKAKDNKKQFFM